MKGRWIGKYWFSGKVPEIIKDKKTEFELEVQQYDNAIISGKIIDNVKMGGTKGVGEFLGTVEGNKIQFVKQMPVSTSILPNGTRIEEDKPHRPIYYKGTLDKEKGSAKGTWKFKFGIGWVNGRIVVFPGTKGNWEMNKQ